MPGHPRRGRIGACALVVAAAAACGTTVPESAQQAAGGAPGLTAPSAGAAAPATPGLPTGVAGAPSQSATTSGPGGTVIGPGAGRGSAPGAGPGGSGTSGSASVAGSASGLTATTISIGIGYSTNGDAADAAFGAANITQGNGRDDAQAVIKDINAHGGIAGRKIVPVWNAEDVTSTATKSSQEQSWCANYTQDHHVFAAIDYDLGDGELLRCVTRSALLIGDDEAAGPLVGFDRKEFAEFPYFLDPGTLELDNEAEAEVPLLVRQGYFSGWDATTGSPGPAPAKVGVLGIDAPAFDRQLDQALLPTLSREGVHVDPSDVFRIYSPPSTQDDGTTVQAIQTATLRMRRDGVDHVIDMDDNGSLTLLFANDAYSQHYYPRLGINTAAGLQALSGDIQQASENGAEGLGWYPLIDLPSTGATDNSGYSSPGRRHCAAVLRANGITFSSTNAEAVALTYCDDLYFLQRVIDASSVITRDSFVAAAERLGTSFPAAAVPSMRFATGRKYGVAEGWDMRYVSSCQCVKYFGAPFALS